MFTVQIVVIYKQSSKMALSVSSAREHLYVIQKCISNCSLKCQIFVLLSLKTIYHFFEFIWTFSLFVSSCVFHLLVCSIILIETQSLIADQFPIRAFIYRLLQLMGMCRILAQKHLTHKLACLFVFIGYLHEIHETCPYVMLYIMKKLIL